MAKLFRRILVPHDFSVPAGKALRLAADLAAEHGGKITVLHVVTPFYPVAEFAPVEGGAWIPPAELVGQVQKRLEAAVTRTLGRRGRATCKVVIGDPYQRIMNEARRADSIVMATAGRTGLAHLLIGSVAEKVVRHAPVPVLTVHPSGGRTSRR